MSINILELLKGQIGKAVLGKIGNVLGADEEQAGKAVEAGLPSILGGLIKQSSTEKGAADLHAQLQEEDGGILDSIGDIFGGDDADGKRSGMLENGTKLLGGLFGDKLGGLGDVIGKFSGLSSEKSGSLLGMLAPLVMGMLGKQSKSLGLDANGFAGLMSEQKEHVAAALPQGLLGDLDLDLGIGDLGIVGSVKDGLSDAASAVTGAAGSAAGAAGDAIGSVGNAAAGAASATAGVARDAVGATGDAAAAAGSGIGKLLVPVVVIAALAFGGWTLMKKMGGGDTPEAGAGVEAPAKPEGGLSLKAPGGLDVPNIEMPKIEMPKLDIPGLGGAGEKLQGLFSDTTEALGSVSDVESAKTAAAGLTDIGSSLDNLGLSKLSPDILSKLGGPIGQIMPQIQGLVEKAYAIPGVEGVLKPAVDGLMAKFGAITGG